MIKKKKKENQSSAIKFGATLYFRASMKYGDTSTLHLLIVLHIDWLSDTGPSCAHKPSVTDRRPRVGLWVQSE